MIHKFKTIKLCTGQASGSRKSPRDGHHDKLQLIQKAATNYLTCAKSCEFHSAAKVPYKQLPNTPQPHRDLRLSTSHIVENEADPKGLEIMVQQFTASLKGISDVPRTDPNMGFPLDFQRLTNTGYLLMGNAFRVTGRSCCSAYYVHSHPSLILAGRIVSKPSRISLTVEAELCQCMKNHNPAIKVTNPGQSEQIG